MKKLYTSLLICLLYASSIGAQQRSFDYTQLLQSLEWELLAGNKLALRDLGSLLDKKEYAPYIRQLLLENSLFTPEELSISPELTKEDFLEFYYDKEAELDFSIITDVFYLTPPGQHKGQFRVGKVAERENPDVSSQLRNYTLEIENVLAARKYKKLEGIIRKIAQLQSKEAKDFLMLWVQNGISQLPEEYRPTIFEAVWDVLQNHRELNCLLALLQMVEKEYVSSAFAAPYLTKLTNVSVTEDGQFDQLVPRYQHYLDSLHSLEEIRAFGYEKLFSYQPNFFALPVDYYGRLLSDARSYSWIRHNALADLMESEHPRTLFYIAAQVYKSRNRKNHLKQSDPQLYFDLIQQLTGLEVVFQDAQGKYTSTPQDLVSRRNFLIYWAKHYSDYEWDSNHQRFTNKMEAAEITQNYEKLFRRLPSRNDSVALASFRQLTEGEPGQIIELAQKYRQLLRNYNSTLPAFQYQYLEQLTLLTDYCRRNNFSYKLRSSLRQQLEKLVAAETPKERYHLENKIIEHLKLEEVTALEYWACLNEKNMPVNFSVGRILDRFYSHYWRQILAEEQELRLYLKKSYLFENIGVLGVCNAYLRKFDINDPFVQDRLHTLIKVESDNEIGNQIMQLIDQPEEEESLGLVDFLEDPLSFSRREIKILAAPTGPEAEQIVRMMRNSKDLDLVKILFYYLRLHPAMSEVPYLFTLIDDERILSSRRGQIITVGSNIIPIIEDVYSYHYPTESEDQRYNQAAWKALWEKDQANYLDWGLVFFEETIKNLSLQETLDIEDINQITESSYFQAKHKQACLEALTKVRPIRNIKRLNLEPKLSVKDDLVYFQNIEFGYKELDDIPKLFDVDQPEIMVDFMNTKSANFSATDRGSFYNNLFRAPWFAAYINSGKADPQLAHNIRDILQTYLQESEFMSEFEEQTTNLNIAQINTIGKPLEERLSAATDASLEEGSRIKIQQSIIATISYSEISTVLQYLDRFTVPQGGRAFDFLHKDFGLPIFELDHPQDFIKRQKSLSESQLYQYYLDEFGVDYTDARGNLDYQKIYEILQFDIVAPFVGENGGKRDDYSYGIIKLLELHFKTRLGFHEKLNEGQTFYTFSSVKRAAAWMDFLEEKQLVPVRVVSPTSYNLVREESQ